MSNIQIPDDIQVLLDCLTSRTDLELEEMLPLQNWIDNTEGGEHFLSKALDQNQQLETALSEIEISVPKTLKRKVSSYVRQNTEGVESDQPRSANSSQKDTESSGPLWKGAKYLAGLTVGLAALVLVGASIVYIKGFYVQLDSNQVALDSIDWIEQIDKGKLWKPVAPGNYQPIEYFDENVAVMSISEINTKYGATEAYDLWHTKREVRGVLFVFHTNNKYDYKFIGKASDYSDRNRQIGIAKDGNTGYVLTVHTQITSDYQAFIAHDYRGPELAFLLRAVWLLC